MILIIEDDPNWQGIYKRILRQEKLSFCSDGFIAMQLLEQQPPQLIILDLSLIGPNGIAILNELQSYPNLSTIPIIINSNTPITLKNLSIYPDVVASFDKAKITPKELQKEVQKYAQ